MIPDNLLKAINTANASTSGKIVSPPKYDPETHVAELSSNEYYRNLIYLRDLLKKSSDVYMADVQNALNIDLFMLTTSVSSPMGPGSDSEPLPIKFGKHDAYLTDSSQFGFEPLLMNGIEKVYCYLPSMRGEKPDARHLNQFFHCEMEIVGNLDEMMTIVEDFIKFLAKVFLEADQLLQSTSQDNNKTQLALSRVVEVESFKRIEFDDACELLSENGYSKFINNTPHGRDISSEGELKLSEILGATTPFWITKFDRDRVPFYQKPDLDNPDKVLCADMIFPALVESSFGGEIVGAGQRQDNPQEMYDSLKRQSIHADAYEWYINLRKSHAYIQTSGFGLGIERFIAWCLCLTSIRDGIIYPREKDILAKP